VRFWLPFMFEPTDQLADVARLAEEHGFEGIGLADHVVVPEGFRSVHPSGDNPFAPSSSFPDPLTSIATMAAATSRLRFMTYVYVLPLREPFSVAKQVATVAMLSGYRVALGAGAGWLVEEMEVMGRDAAARGRRMDEMLAVIRDFWDDGYAELHGEFFDFGRSAMFPVPEQRIPVWIGGKSDAALRRAVVADGWLGMNYDLDEVDALLDRLRAMRKAEGDDREDFEVFVIANAEPTVDLYRGLEDRGVTSTMGMPWYPGDPAHASLDAKRAALERFHERLIAPLESPS